MYYYTTRIGFGHGDQGCPTVSAEDDPRRSSFARQFHSAAFVRFDELDELWGRCFNILLIINNQG